MDPLVELDTGSIRGLIEKHDDGFDYYAFKGIPFAEPPVGELRFEDPVPKKKWTGVLDCKNYGPVCCQLDYFMNKVYYGEDCLHLNVYTRVINKLNENRAVIVWIHGGEFSFGSADDTYCGPDYLIRKDIVLVTINFRVGVLGFLDLEDEVASGNQGLKDQVMALQWIQRNIRLFGGNPENVTVGGITAGAAAAHYLALSPLNKNLVHKIICHGNVVFSSWAAINNPRSNALKLCSFLGKTSTDSKEILDFLKTVDTKTLLEAQQRLKDSLDSMAFGPGSDSKSPNPFMPIHRYLAADQGIHLPSLVGFTSREGLLMLYAGDLDFGKMMVFNTPHILERYNLNKNQLRRLYYKNEPVSVENADKYAEFSGEMHFIEGIHRFARVQDEKSSAPTYIFRFDYESPDLFSKLILPDKVTGAGHNDDIPFLFKMGILKASGGKYFEKGTQSYRVMEQITEMWTNFAAYGRPTIDTSELIPVHWKPNADGTILRYMNIGEDLTMQTMVNVDQKFLSATGIRA